MWCPVPSDPSLYMLVLVSCTVSLILSARSTSASKISLRHSMHADMQILDLLHGPREFGWRWLWLFRWFRGGLAVFGWDGCFWFVVHYLDNVR
jgi:hypothetical protein